MSYPEPPLHADEFTMLAAYLDYYRAVVEDKASGLPDAQIAERHPPSSLSLGGIVHHLALVEEWWFRQCFLGEDAVEPWLSAPWDDDPDWDFTFADQLHGETILGRYRESCERSRQAVASRPDLATPSVRANKEGEHWSLRWILVHMIEETARHAGHADLIRESIDGETGDFRA
ncbi:MAG: DinB family protein [Acidimicrobiia bacterium]|nr:DinB family protein [Acidimicrobiia bacterium]